MNREDAIYYMNLLMLDFSDDYDEWLNSYLESETPLSDIVLNLACSGSDKEKTISILYDYCAEYQFDKARISNRLELFFKKAYYSNRLSVAHVLTIIKHMARNFYYDESLTPNQMRSFFQKLYYSERMDREALLATVQCVVQNFPYGDITYELWNVLDFYSVDEIIRDFEYYLCVYINNTSLN